MALYVLQKSARKSANFAHFLTQDRPQTERAIERGELVLKPRRLVVYATPNVSHIRATKKNEKARPAPRRCCGIIRRFAYGQSL
ncbi:hypothetical protein KTD19_03325 [Burkholderia multivorans]|uniref:hypothetical protein n=1 Tax=Burkholderia multivorans TaxID=87883 RepID=UPI001C214DD3|nr:hypothetical protein [Burkholderia multivorans]MBU9231407.1 hypothetical protein [Burkholderia multivorans]